MLVIALFFHLSLAIHPFSIDSLNWLIEAIVSIRSIYVSQWAQLSVKRIRYIWTTSTKAIGAFVGCHWSVDFIFHHHPPANELSLESQSANY